MIKCIAIDDEPLALRQITGYIKKTPYLELAAECENALAAIKTLDNTHVDLMYVDINMPDLSGMDFVKSLDHPPKIIFTTAYHDYALDGFRVDALGYLLKPISYPEFLKASNKAKNYFETNAQKKIITDGISHSLFVKSGYKSVRINLDDISYIEGMREYVRIHITDGKPLMPLISLRTLEKELPSSMFMRVHRSYIVNLVKIQSFDNSGITIDDKTVIPVSDQYKDAFLKYIRSHSLE
jgi:two-component system LytT family response regulator